MAVAGIGGLGKAALIFRKSGYRLPGIRPMALRQRIIPLLPLSPKAPNSEDEYILFQRITKIKKIN
jgi:hypothetical protein